MEENFVPNVKRSKKPRKIPVIRSSKYEGSEAIHSNKKYWQSVFNELDALTTAPSEEEQSKKLAEVLPPELYEKVCQTLDIPVNLQSPKIEIKKCSEHKPRRLVKKPLLSYRKALSIDRELDSDTDVEISPRQEAEEGYNVHQEFLRRSEREQVTWATRYLQPEREDEKNLVRRADDLTDRIAQEFCQYMKQLGGDQQSQLFTPKAIKELFQVEFDTHVAQSLRVIPKELPTLQDKVAILANHPEKSRHAFLEQEVTKDIKAENQPDKFTAFGRSLPKEDRWQAPHNETKSLWRSARHVPKDLVTLKTVWEGITNLRSVKEYCRWMIDHPEHRRAPYLRSLGMFDPAVLGARLTMESQHGLTPPFLTNASITPPAPIDHIRRRLSQLADSN